MKKLLPVLSFLALSSVVALSQHTSTPAPAAQPGSSAQGLEARVATLEGELLAEKKRHDETRLLLDQTIAYLEKQSKAAQTLLGVLDVSEQQGFAVGENWGSRVTLLAGLRAYWGDEQKGLPKLPAPLPPKPAPPTRTRPVREE